jgi:hypothetical protein
MAPLVFLQCFEPLIRIRCSVDVGRAGRTDVAQEHSVLGRSQLALSAVRKAWRHLVARKRASRLRPFDVEGRPFDVEGLT